MQSTQVHYNQVLTDLAVEFTPPDIKCNELFLPLPVTADTDVYYVFDKDLFDAPDDFRADGTPSNKSNIGWKAVPYVCQEHALHDVITKKMRRNAQNQIDLEGRKTIAVKQKILNRRELAAFGPNGILRQAANNGYTDNSVAWTTPATDDIRTPITAAINAVEQACGKTPNTIALGTDVARYIMNTAQYRTETNFWVDIQKLGTGDLPTVLYNMKPVYIGSLVNTNNRGQSKTPTRVMGADVWIGYIDPSGTLGMEQLSYGAEILSEEYASSWYDDDLRGDKVEYGRSYTLQVVAKECGGLLTAVLT
jgi:hypothetical protein